MHTCQPPEYKNLEMSRNLCIVRMSLKTMSRNNPQKSPKRHSERPGDLMKNLETPGKTGRVGGYDNGSRIFSYSVHVNVYQVHYISHHLLGQPHSPETQLLRISSSSYGKSYLLHPFHYLKHLILPPPCSLTTKLLQVHTL